jgi:hypothetical protein
MDKDKIGKARVSLGSTINVGNYESARVEVSVEYPFHVDEDDVDAVIDSARSVARRKLRAFTEGYEKSGAVQAHKG